MTMNSGSAFGDNTGDTSDDQIGGRQNMQNMQNMGDVQETGTSTGQTGTNVEQARQQVGQVTQQVKDAASQATTAVSDATRRSAEQAKDAAGRLVGQATDQARQLTQQFTQQVSEQGANMFNDQKSRAAGSLSGIGAALRCAADTLQNEQDKNLSYYASSLADGVESAASYIRDSDARRLMNDAGDFARRRPEWVLGGAFIAGLAIVRFLKASRSDTAATRYDEMGGASHLDYATSDDFEVSDEIARRYRVDHPGIGGTSPDAGPDTDDMTGGRDFARSDQAHTNVGPDDGPDVAVTTDATITNASGTDADMNMNPDSNPTETQRINPSPGMTL